jgi:hypothetical protein
MSLSSWLCRALSRSCAPSAKRRIPAGRPKTARLFLEHLEDRALPSSYTAASVSALIADITAANAAGGANTIALTAPTTSPYVLTTFSSQTNHFNGLPVIAANDELTIVGNGDTIRRSSAPSTPDIRLLDVATGASLTLQNLTLQGGLVSYVVGAQGNCGGGAIFSQGTLVLNGVTVQDNMAEAYPAEVENGAGGGIYCDGGLLTLEGGTIIQNNEAIGASTETNDGPWLAGNGLGGGVYASDTIVSVTNSTLDNNTASGGCGAIYLGNGGNGYGYGGGLYASAGCTVTLTNATLDGNVAKNLALSAAGGGAYGGGLYLACSATLTNCAVQGNSALVQGNPALGIGVGDAVGYGGGLYITGNGVSLDAATVAQVTDNTAISGAAYDNIDGPYAVT